MSTAPATAPHSPNPTPNTQHPTPRPSVRKHGFLSSVIPSNSGGWQTLLEGLYRSLRPANEMEQLIVDQIGIAYLRLSRLYVHETNVDMHAIIYNALLPNLPKESKKKRVNMPFGAAAYIHGAETASVSECFRSDDVSDDVTDGIAPEPKKRHFEDDRAHLRIRYETMLTRQITRSLALLDKLQAQTSEKDWTEGASRNNPPFLPAFMGLPSPEELLAKTECQEPVGTHSMRPTDQMDNEQVEQPSVPGNESTEDPMPTPSVSSVPNVPLVPSTNAKARNRAILAQIRSERRQNTISREKAARRA